MDYLVFRLYGAMASWGEIAVGEVRHSASYPSKSALLGLIAAALGIKRDNEDGHSSLAAGYQFAIKQQSGGHLLRDYHTIQVPDAVGKFRYRTRRDELVTGRDRLGTNLSIREYYSDSVSLVAVKALADAPFSLEEICAALLRPKFHLYLGRKSFPLSAPLAPQLVNGQRFMAALDSYTTPPIMRSHTNDNTRDRYWLSLDGLQRYYWEGELNDFAESGKAFDSDKVQTLTRHDQPRSRKRWQFQQRLEHFYQREEENPQRQFVEGG